MMLRLIQLRVVLALAVVMACALHGCTSRSPAPQLPSLDGAEPQVKAFIEQAHAELAADTSVADAWGKYGMALDVHDFAQPALDAYTKASELAPGEFKWWYYRANRIARTDPAAAIPLFEKARDIRPDYAALYVHMGRSVEQLGKWDEARTLFQKALEFDPRSALAYAGVGRSQLAAGNISEARTALERALELDPNCGVAFASLAQVYDRQGEAERAEVMTARAADAPQQGTIDDPVLGELEAMGRSTDQVINRAGVLARAGAADRAVEELNALIKAQPSRAEAYIALGQHQLQLQRFEDGLASFRQARTLDPNSLNAQLGIADALRFARRPGEALKEYREVINQNPSFGEAYRGLGICLIQQNELTGAAVQLRKALELLPADRSVRSALSRLEYFEFHDQAVVDVLKPLLPSVDVAAPPDRITLDAILYSGLAKLRLGEDEDGTALIESAIAAGHDAGLVAHELGEIGRSDLGIAILRQALQRNPNDVNAIFSLVYELSASPDDRVRNGAEALQLAQRVMQRGVGGFRGLEMLACAYAEVGRFADAIEALEQAKAVASQGAPQVVVTQIENKLELFRRNEPFRYELHGEPDDEAK